MLNAQKKRQRNPVVGFDIVELMDSPMAKPTAFLAAKLYYKMLAYYHLAEKQTFIKSNSYEKITFNCHGGSSLCGFWTK